MFKLTPPAHGGAWTQTTLYSFTGAADGGNPYAALIEDANGVLYSTTSAGGTTGCGGYGCGTVFALTPPAPGQSTWTESVLYAFTGATDGSYPTAELTAFDGALFTPSAYGGALGEGAILEFTPPPPGSTTWSEQVAYSFGAPGDGQYPSGDLLAAGGALYTTTAFGGTHNIGTVVELTPPSSPGNVWTDSVLHSFDGFDGLYPSADLLADNAGNVYSTSGGGRGGCFGEDGACGIAFKLTPPVSPQTTWTEHVLYYFVGSIDYDPSSGLIADSHGSLYGTTAAGGPSGAGVVYKLAHSGKSTWSQTILRAFDGGADGGNPYDDLIDDSYGNLYGVAGGGIGDGVVYELTK